MYILRARPERTPFHLCHTPSARKVGGFVRNQILQGFGYDTSSRPCHKQGQVPSRWPSCDSRHHLVWDFRYAGSAYARARTSHAYFAWLLRSCFVLQERTAQIGTTMHNRKTPKHQPWKQLRTRQHAAQYARADTYKDLDARESPKHGRSSRWSHPFSLQPRSVLPGGSPRLFQPLRSQAERRSWTEALGDVAVAVWNGPSQWGTWGNAFDFVASHMIKKARTLSKNYVTVTTVGLAPGTNQTYVCIVEELCERLCVLQVVLSLGRRWC